MSGIDQGIILFYLCSLIVLGLFLRRRASQSIQSYFLGGRRIPWWVLGISGTTSFLDMTGTMVIASFFYIVGVKGILVELRGGVALILAFLMIFMGKWYSRSKVMTTAEWMEFRFGSGKQGNAARLLNAVVNIVNTVAMVGYFFVGTGKFLSLFLPFSPRVCSLIMISVCLFYTAMSGLFGVVYTDLLQAVLIVFATVYVSVKAFLTIDAEKLQAIAPAGWTDITPRWFIEMPSGYEIYHLFGLSVMFFFLKVMIEGFAGQQAMVAQRYFASPSDRDSGRLSALWTFCLSFRWPFIMGIAVLGLYLGDKVSEPEMVLPAVLATLIPAGIKGLVIAALIAAAMSTFDSTINAGASYLVKDIYEKFINPRASEKRLIKASYASSILIVVFGVLIGAVTPSINAIWGWITMSLGAGMMLPLLLRWYWWRFNGYGYAIGTAIGTFGAILQKIFVPSLPEWTAFLIVGGAAILGMLIGTCCFPPTDKEVLDKFYAITKPMGFWKPVTLKMKARIVRSIKRENHRDLFALVFAIPWQMSLFLTPIHAVIHEWNRFSLFLSVFFLSSIGLYFTWYRFLKGGDQNNRT
jgi:SSS family solute:Na+ symporter